MRHALTVLRGERLWLAGEMKTVPKTAEGRAALVQLASEFADVVETLKLLEEHYGMQESEAQTAPGRSEAAEADPAPELGPGTAPLAPGYVDEPDEPALVARDVFGTDGGAALAGAAQAGAQGWPAVRGEAGVGLSGG